MEYRKIRPRPDEEKETLRQRKGLDALGPEQPLDERKGMSPEEIAALDRRTMEEPEGEAFNSPTPGGDPEHKRPLKDETNRLTT